MTPKSAIVFCQRQYFQIFVCSVLGFLNHPLLSNFVLGLRAVFFPSILPSHTVRRSESLLSMCPTQFFCLSLIVCISILFSFTIEFTIHLLCRWFCVPSIWPSLFSSTATFQILLIAPYSLSAMSTSLSRLILQSISRSFSVPFSDSFLVCSAGTRCSWWRPPSLIFYVSLSRSGFDNLLLSCFSDSWTVLPVQVFLHQYWCLFCFFHAYPHHLCFLQIDFHSMFFRCFILIFPYPFQGLRCYLQPLLDHQQILQLAQFVLRL